MYNQSSMTSTIISSWFLFYLFRTLKKSERYKLEFKIYVNETKSSQNDNDTSHCPAC